MPQIECTVKMNSINDKEKNHLSKEDFLSLIIIFIFVWCGARDLRNSYMQLM